MIKKSSLESIECTTSNSSSNKQEISNIAIEKATLTIYDIQGRTIDTKNISLNESINDIAVNPIRSAGVYIVEIGRAHV